MVDSPVAVRIAAAVAAIVAAVERWAVAQDGSGELRSVYAAAGVCPDNVPAAAHVAAGLLDVVAARLESVAAACERAVVALERRTAGPGAAQELATDVGAGDVVLTPHGLAVTDSGAVVVAQADGTTADLDPSAASSYDAAAVGTGR